MLATSRQPLALAGERVWELPPLEVPDPGDEASVERLLKSPAVRLFLARATAVQPGFSLTAYVAPAVAEVWRRLDGIPLAIELAAARVAQLTSQEIAGRLTDRFTLLADGDERPARHRTLQAALSAAGWLVWAA